MIPSVGRIVHYTLTEDDATRINKRRKDAEVSEIAKDESGAVVHYGNQVKAGDVYPRHRSRLGRPRRICRQRSSATRRQRHLLGYESQRRRKPRRLVSEVIST